MQLSVAIAVIVAANAFITDRLAIGTSLWTSVSSELIASAAINIGVVTVFAFALNRLGGSFQRGSTLFFLALLTLIDTLYDRYRNLRLRSPDRVRRPSTSSSTRDEPPTREIRAPYPMA